MDDGSPLGGVVCPAGFNQGRLGAKWNRPDVLEHQSLHETKPIKLKTSALPPEILRNQQTLSLSLTLSHTHTHSLTHTHTPPHTHTLTYTHTRIHSFTHDTLSLSLSIFYPFVLTLFLVSHTIMCVWVRTHPGKNTHPRTHAHTHMCTRSDKRETLPQPKITLTLTHRWQSHRRDHQALDIMASEVSSDPWIKNKMRKRNKLEGRSQVKIKCRM